MGKQTDFTYPIKHLGSSLNILIDIITGKHFFCKEIKKAKNPLIIVGENILYQKNGYYLIRKLKNLSVLKKKINFFNTKTSLINFFEINFFNKTLKKNISKTYYLYNTNFLLKIIYHILI